jgi:hypothetical protein
MRPAGRHVLLQLSAAPAAATQPGASVMILPPCAYCHARPLAVAKKGVSVYSLIVACYTQTRTYVGCEPCVDRLVRGDLLTTALAGWWSIPGLIRTPIALAQNGQVVARWGPQPALHPQARAA